MSTPTTQEVQSGLNQGQTDRPSLTKGSSDCPGDPVSLALVVVQARDPDSDKNTLNMKHHTVF